MKKINVAIIGGTGTQKLQEVLRETVLHLAEKRQCPCGHALREARFKE